MFGRWRGFGVGKPSYTIDGLACCDFASAVSEFNRVFGRWWGDSYWDGNLDVFNDIIDWPNDYGSYTLIWSESESARAHLGHQAMTGWLRSKLDECVPGAPAWDEWQRGLGALHVRLAGRDHQHTPTDRAATGIAERSYQMISSQ
jgi:hypothetical protein